MRQQQLKLLPSGYFHFRLSDQRWAQWPSHRECTPDDAFGWDPAKTARLANAELSPEPSPEPKETT
jgi:hypothetical protein